jgi:hypothetical protein
MGVKPGRPRVETGAGFAESFGTVLERISLLACRCRPVIEIREVAA